MLVFDDIKVEIESQGFKGTRIGTSPQKDKTVMFLESMRSTDAVLCPVCGDGVYIYENYHVNLKDMPLCKDVKHTCSCMIQRYRCNSCQETFTEEIPFKYPGTRITYRAANWIKGFLQQKVSITVTMPSSLLLFAISQFLPFVLHPTKIREEPFLMDFRKNCNRLQGVAIQKISF